MKTKPTKVKPENFVKQNFPAERQKEILEMVKLFEKATGEKCVMWNKIFGFGEYSYQGKSTKGVCMATGFAVPKNGFTVYTMCGHKSYPEILKRIGKYKDTGKSCMFFKSLSDIDKNVLQELIKTSIKDLNNK